MVVGLTGGIATGKSTVSAMIREIGIPVVDADEIARAIVNPGEEALEKIAREFGEDVIHADGTLNRMKLGSIVFSDRSKLERLNEITHPEIKRRIENMIDDYRKENHRCCFIDIPLLIESGYEDIVDMILLVYADRDTQLQRLMKRNNYSYEEAIKRINAQMDIEEKKNHADYLIDNRGGMESTRKQLIGFLRKICYMEGLDD